MINPAELYAALNAGVNALDLNEHIRFQAYSRRILPIDQSVFWTPTTLETIEGSLHYAQEVIQNEEETFAMATVIFTAQEKVALFEAQPTDVIFVAATPGGTRYAFHQQQGFYSAAQQWHYFGHSIPPAMLTQLLDKPGQIDFSRAVVSNSLPLWLQLNNFTSIYGDVWTNKIPLFPAKLVPANQPSPYIAVDIQTSDAIQSFAHIDRSRSSHQLMSDHVRLVLYGLQHNEADDFKNLVTWYSETYGLQTFGIRNMPAITDWKREHPGIEAIAMKKTIDYDVSYIQSRVEAVARTLIREATFVLEVVPYINIVGTLATQGGFTLTTQAGQVIAAQ